MTERFIVEEHIDEDDCLNSYRLIQDNETGLCYGSFTKVCKLLNTLSEANKTVQKTNLKLLERETLLLDEMEANEKLVNDLNELKEIGDYQAERIKELTKENEDLMEAFIQQLAEIIALKLVVE